MKISQKKILGLLFFLSILVFLERCSGSSSKLNANLESSLSGESSLSKGSLESFPSLPNLTAEEQFKRIQEFIRSGLADSLWEGLSQNSTRWIDRVVRESNHPDSNSLAKEPFYHVLAVVVLKLKKTEDPFFAPQGSQILEQLLLQVPSMRQSFISFPLGDFTQKGKTAEVGLKETPRTPVFFMVEEEGIWKLDLLKSLPLLLKGAENQAFKRHKEVIPQVFWILDKAWGKKVESQVIFH